MKKNLLFIYIFFAGFSCFSQIGGAYTYSFLDLPNSSQVSALGGFNVSLTSSDVILNNPAMNDSAFSGEISLSYVNYPGGINWGYSRYNFNTNKLGNFAVALQYINYGKFISATEQGEITGKFYASDYIFSGVWSYYLDSLWRVGAIFKPIFSSYETYFSFGIATDLGLSYVNEKKRFSAGLVFRNIGFQIKPYTASNYENLPFDIQIGVTKGLKYAPFRISVLAHHLNKPYLGYDKSTKEDYVSQESKKKQSKVGELADLTLRHFIIGLEFIPSKKVYIAAGYNYQRRQELKLESHTGLTGFSVGFGIRIKKISINYSIAKYHIARSSHNFTLSLNVNNIIKKYNN